LDHIGAQRNLMSDMDGNRLDFWDEELRLFGVAPSGQRIDANLAERRTPGYTPLGMELDHADRMEGDLSLVYTPADAGMQPTFGFVAGLWGEQWKLTPDTTLCFWTKSKSLPDTSWQVRLIDVQGRMAQGTLPRNASGSEWLEVKQPLSALQVDPAFDWNDITMLEFEAEIEDQTRIHLDGVCFESDGIVIGVTDKSLKQRTTEAEQNRSVRVETALRNAAEDESGPIQSIVAAFAKMMKELVEKK